MGLWHERHVRFSRLRDTGGGLAGRGAARQGRTDQMSASNPLAADNPGLFYVVFIAAEKRRRFFQDREEVQKNHCKTVWRHVAAMVTTPQ